MLPVTRHYEDTIQQRLMFLISLCSKFTANNHLNVERFDKVIAKIKWCSFFDSQCRINKPVPLTEICSFVIKVAQGQTKQVILEASWSNPTNDSWKLTSPPLPSWGSNDQQDRKGDWKGFTMLTMW